MPPIRPSSQSSRSRKSSEALRLGVLAGSLVFIVAAIIVIQILSREEPLPPADLPTPVPVQVIEVVDCLVAIDKIEPGTSLDPTRFRKESRPVISNSAGLVMDFDKLRGTYAASFIAAGQPLLVDYMTTKAPVNEIQANIPEGFRAVTVLIDEVSNVEGWVRAGAKVDVMLASQVGGKPAITLLVQNAKVLSTGKLGGGNNRGGNTTVTILVTVEEATKIQLASSSGAMNLALRGDEDTVEAVDKQAVTLESVFGMGTPQPMLGPPREGSIRFGGRNYLIISGKLVPEESLVDNASKESTPKP